MLSQQIILTGLVNTVYAELCSILPTWFVFPSLNNSILVSGCNVCCYLYEDNNDLFHSLFLTRVGSNSHIPAGFLFTPSHFFLSVLECPFLSETCLRVFVMLAHLFAPRH